MSLICSSWFCFGISHFKCCSKSQEERGTFGAGRLTLTIDRIMIPFCLSALVATATAAYHGIPEESCKRSLNYTVSRGRHIQTQAFTEERPEESTSGFSHIPCWFPSPRRLPDCEVCWWIPPPPLYIRETHVQPVPGAGQPVTIAQDEDKIYLSNPSMSSIVELFEYRSSPPYRNWTKRPLENMSHPSSYNDSFGFSYRSLYGMVFIGAPDDQTTTNSEYEWFNPTPNTLGTSVGAVYQMWRNPPPQWTARHLIKAPHTESGDMFGYSLEIFSNLLLVGAPFEKADDIGVNNTRGTSNGKNVGVVLLFDTNAPMKYHLRIKPDVPYYGDMAFGSNLFVQGLWLLVGAPLDERCDLPTAIGCAGRGSVWVYVFNWNTLRYDLNTTLRSPTPQNGELFGTAVSASSHDYYFPERIYIGAPGEGSCENTVVSKLSAGGGCLGSGAVYEFVFSRVTRGWAAQRALKGSRNAPSANFGATLIWKPIIITWDTSRKGQVAESRVAESRQGKVAEGSLSLKLVVGAPGDDCALDGYHYIRRGPPCNAVSEGVDSGALYMFADDDGDWVEAMYVKELVPQPGARLGSKLSFGAQNIKIVHASTLNGTVVSFHIGYPVEL